MPAAEADVGGREIAGALVRAGLVVMPDEGGDLPFGILRRVVIFEQDAAFQGLVPALDPAPRPGMAGRAPDVPHALAVEPGGKIGRDA